MNVYYAIGKMDKIDSVHIKDTKYSYAKKGKAIARYMICSVCNTPKVSSMIDMEHIIRKADGGNIVVPVCKECHAEKTLYENSNKTTNKKYLSIVKKELNYFGSLNQKINNVLYLVYEYSKKISKKFFDGAKNFLKHLKVAFNTVKRLFGFDDDLMDTVESMIDFYKYRRV